MIDKDAKLRMYSRILLVGAIVLMLSFMFAGAVKIGGRDIGYFNGTIDDVWIINKSLTAEEVQQLYFVTLFRYDLSSWILLINQSKTSISGLDEGTYSYQAYASDEVLNDNQTEERWVTILTNVAPDDPAPVLASVDGSNSTLSDLNCSSLISDPDADNINVTVNWYRNDTLNSTIYYHDNYENGTNFSALLGQNNLSVDDSWECGLIVSDGRANSSWVNSSNITIIDSVAPDIGFVNFTTSAGQTANTWISANVSAIDVHLDSIVVYLYNNTKLINTSISSNATFFVNYTGLSPGNYYLNASANDTSGNINNTETRKIIIANPLIDCVEIATPGYYSLVQDIVDSKTSDCIDISANHVVLDCGWHVIDGNRKADRGIRVYRTANQFANVTIKDCYLSDWDTTNIYVDDANNVTFENIITTSSPDDGIDIRDSQFNSLINLTANASRYGINMEYGGNNSIVNSTIRDNSFTGIYVYYSADNSIYNNLFNQSRNYWARGNYFNEWNTSIIGGNNIIGGINIGGNYWADPSGNGYSDTCIDVEGDGICDSEYVLSRDNIDHLPLTTPDLYPPSVSIYSPVNNSVVNGNVTIKVAASDNKGIGNVTFELKNSTSDWIKLCNITIPPYDCPWDTGLFTNSTDGYDIRAIGYDYVGNSNISLIHFELIDRGAPYLKDITVIYPSGQNSVRGGQLVILKLNATDSPAYGAGMNVTVVNVSVLNGSGIIWMNHEYGSLVSDQWSLWNLTVNISSTTGPKYARIFSYDNSTPLNNIRNSEVFYVEIDNLAPTYSGLGDSDDYGDISNSSQVDFFVNAFDNFNLSSYIFSSNITGSWQNDSKVFIDGTGYSISLEKTAYTGNYSYKFYIYDDAENLKETELGYINVSDDDVDFNIYLTDPTNNASISSGIVNMTFYYEVGTAQNCSLYLDGALNDSILDPLNVSIYNFTKTVQSGTHDWYVGCFENETNNSYYSDVWIYTVLANTLPILTNFSIRDGLNSYDNDSFDTHDITPDIRWNTYDANGDPVTTYVCISSSTENRSNDMCDYSDITTQNSMIDIVNLSYNSTVRIYYVKLTPYDQTDYGTEVNYTIYINNSLPVVGSFNTTVTHDPTPELKWNVTDADNGSDGHWPADSFTHYIRLGNNTSIDAYSTSDSADNNSYTSDLIPWADPGSEFSNRTVNVSIWATDGIATSVSLNTSFILTDYLPSINELKMVDADAYGGACTTASNCLLNPEEGGNTTVMALLNITDIDNDCDEAVYDGYLILCLNFTDNQNCNDDNNANYTFELDNVYSESGYCLLNFTSVQENNTPEFFRLPGHYRLHINISSQAGERLADTLSNQTWEYGTLKAINYSSSVILGSGTVNVGQWNDGANEYLLTNWGNDVLDLVFNASDPTSGANIWNLNGTDFAIDDDNDYNSDAGSEPFVYLNGTDRYFNYSTGLQVCSDYSCDDADINDTLATYYHIAPPAGLTAGVYTNAITITLESR